MAVPQPRIERDAAALLWHILAGDTNAQPVIEQLTTNPMVLFAPWQAAGRYTIDRYRDWPNAARKLQCIATNKPVRQIDVAEDNHVVVAGNAIHFASGYHHSGYATGFAFFVR